MTVLLILLTIHFIADFLFQTDWMALNKSKNNEALAAHVLLYSVCFAWYGVAFMALTFTTHFITDYWTSRLTSKLFFFGARTPGVEGTDWYYIPGRRHWFFCAIGLDQLIHAFTLAITYALVFGG